MSKGSKILLIVAIVLIVTGSVFALVKNTEKKHVKNIQIVYGMDQQPVVIMVVELKQMLVVVQ